jgi:hypothetical protein
MPYGHDSYTKYKPYANYYNYNTTTNLIRFVVFIRLMRKNKTKRVSYNAVKKNTTLTQFVKEEVVDRTIDIAKLTWELVMKMTKRK